MAKPEEGHARVGKSKDRTDHWVAKEGKGEIAENVKNEEEKTAENIGAALGRRRSSPTRR